MGVGLRESAVSKIPWRPPTFTRAILHQFLRYDPNTGVWIWLVKRNPDIFPGKIAGCVNKTDGRRYITFMDVRYSEHRLAWFYMKGRWPKKDVEHWDGDLTNNRWKNLRLATRTQNQGNARSRVAMKGVTRVRTGKYTAQIQKRMRKIHLGTFDTPEEAHAAYVAKATKLYGAFARAA